MTQLYTSRNQEIVSPNYPHNYRDNTVMCYKIVTDHNTKIHLEFSDFTTEAGQDNLEVFDGIDDKATSLGIFSGDKVPSAITSTSNYIFMRFKTDGSVTKKGFRMLYNVLDEKG